MTQTDFDGAAKRIASLQKKYGINSSQLEEIKKAYEDFCGAKNDATFSVLLDAVIKLERYGEADMSPVFMNI